MKQPQAHGLAMEPYQQSISPAVSPWSSPYRTPQGVSPADTPIITSAGHTPAVSSPVSSENTFTLLPGYVSRPGLSPLKKPRRPSPTRDSGGEPPLCTASLQFPQGCSQIQACEMRSSALAWCARSPLDQQYSDMQCCCAGGFVVPGGVGKAASQARKPGPTAAGPSQPQQQQQQQQAQPEDTSKAAADEAGKGEDAVWRELAEELRQIPRLPDEATRGIEAANASQGLLSALRQAAGAEEAR